MINFDVPKENRQEHNQHQLQFPDHPDRILIARSSESEKRDALLSLLIYQPNIEEVICILRVECKLQKLVPCFPFWRITLQKKLIFYSVKKKSEQNSCSNQSEKENNLSTFGETLFYIFRKQIYEYVIIYYIHVYVLIFYHCKNKEKDILILYDPIL